MGDRIAERLRELGRTQKWLAGEVGIQQPSINAIVRGKEGQSTKYVVEIAKALGVTPEWLKAGRGHRLADILGEAVLVGDIGAGERVIRIEGGVVVQGGIEPPAGYQRAIAARIKGNSMHPLEEGWLVFYEDESGDPMQSLNRLCAVGYEDGTTYIKKLRRSRGKWRLESWNAEPIENAPVKWASPIIEIRPR